MSYYTTILESLSSAKHADVIYLDFAKAFDKVDQGVLLHKLRSYGIGGKVGTWIHNFLSERQQQVRVQGHYSDKEWVQSGVPQGSVLGPLLFAILISDIDAGVLTSSLLTYADDTKIFKAIHSLADLELLLEDDLATLYSWSEVNNQPFNASKFDSLSFSAEGCKHLYFDPTDGPITSKDHVNDATMMQHFIGTSISSRRRHVDYPAGCSGHLSRESEVL